MDIYELRAERQRALDELKRIHAAAADRDLNSGEQRRWDALTAKVQRLDAEIAEVEADRERRRAEVRAAANAGAAFSGDGARACGGLPAGGWSARDEARRVLDRARHMPDEVREAVTGLVERDDEQSALARWAAVASDPAYTRAFWRVLRDPEGGHRDFTDDELTAWRAARAVQRAMAVGTNTTGGFMVPTHLDPTIILTSAGTQNAIRRIARVERIATGTWNGVTSAGVSASWDAELEEVSDDSPTVARASVPLHAARAFVAASFEMLQDVAGLDEQVGRLLSDALDSLQAAAHATGTGSGQPTGIFTALDAADAEVVSTTAATIGLVDLDNTYLAVPARFRSRGTWVMNPKWGAAVKSLGTAVSASFTSTLADPPAEFIHGRPVVYSDDAPTVETTDELDPRIVFGDFSNYVIADHVGSTLSYIPHLFGTTNSRPVGAAGWFLFVRTGADCVNPAAFRLLMDRTSA